MENNIYRKALKEVYVILNSSTYDVIEKLPEELKEYIFGKMDTSYNYTIELGKPLLKQKMMPETKKILTKIYEQYLSV